MGQAVTGRLVSRALAGIECSDTSELFVRSPDSDLSRGGDTEPRFARGRARGPVSSPHSRSDVGRAGPKDRGLLCPPRRAHCSQLPLPRVTHILRDCVPACSVRVRSSSSSCESEAHARPPASGPPRVAAGAPSLAVGGAVFSWVGDRRVISDCPSDILKAIALTAAHAYRALGGSQGLTPGRFSGLEASPVMKRGHEQEIQAPGGNRH